MIGRAAYARSLLFCPADAGARLEKAEQRGADALVLDLEDAVAPERKEHARALAADYVTTASLPTYVRVNPLAPASGPHWGADDVRAVLHPSLAGLVVPKVELGDDLIAVERLCDEAGGLDPDFEIVPLIETARGLVGLSDLLDQPLRRVRRVAFGAGDFTADLGVRWANDPLQTLHARSAVAIASRAAGLAPPIDTASPVLDDRALFTEDTRPALLLGFSAKFCIHPRQLEWVHDLFSPTPEQVRQAQRVVEAYEQAVRSGEGALVVDGRMVDAPIVEMSRSTLERAGALGLVSPRTGTGS